jgi:hypothetical protein
MRRAQTARCLAGLLALAPLASGCIVTHHDLVADGTLTVDWSIGDAKDPGDCTNEGASSLEVTVTTPGGSSLGTYETDCFAFATKISLPPGDYAATATLLDGQGHARSTSIAIHPFTIDSDVDLDIPIDFPTSSFL